MPFTFSHPAIILPLAKFNNKYISVTGLVAGSVAPDFEYFVNMKMEQIHGHTISGMFYYDLPMALALTFIFHMFLRDALIDYSPVPLRQRFKDLREYSWLDRFRKSWFVILYSCLIGVASHLFWDAWTHSGRFFVNLIPFLQGTNVIFGVELGNYAIAQLLSSLVGAIAIFFAVSDTSSRKTWKDDYLIKLIYWILVGLIMTVVIVMRNVSTANEFVATSIAGGLIGMMLAPMLIQYFNLNGKIFDQEKN